MSKARPLLVLTPVLMIGSYFVLDLIEYFSLDFFKAQQAMIDVSYAENPPQTALIFVGVCIAVIGLALPGAAIMTMIGGAIFGMPWELVVVCFASTPGATQAFLVSRFLLRNLCTKQILPQLESDQCHNQKRWHLPPFYAPANTAGCEAPE